MAQFSVASTLDLVGPFLDERLVPGPAWRRARSLAAALPAALAEWVYLECRLGRGTDRTDLTIAVDRGRRDLLAGCDAALGYAGDESDPLWRQLRAFTQAWTSERTQCWKRVPRVWLEFDIEGDAAGCIGQPHRPNLFFEFSGADGVQGLPRAEWGSAAGVGGDFLCGLGGGALTRKAIAQCLELLPAGVRLLYLGVFPPRSTGGVRLCVTGIDDRQLAAYVAAIGWPGPTARLHRDLEWLRSAHGVGAGVVGIDVMESVGPMLGLEYFLERRCQARGVLGETAFLDTLVKEGLSSVERREALNDWVGSQYVLLPHELWESVQHRRVNHVKLTYTRDGWREAKAYLSIGHTMRRRASTQ